MKVTTEKSHFIEQGLMLLIVLALIVFASVAWFITTKTVTGNAPDLAAVDVDKTTMELYHILTKNADGTVATSEKVDMIYIENYLPNQAEEYYLQITNGNQTSRTVSVDFMNINASFTPKVSGVSPDMILAEKIFIKGLRSDSTGAQLNTAITTDETDNSLTILSGVNNNINILQKLVLAQGASSKIYFTFEFQSDAGNKYQQKAIQIEEVKMTITQ